jgi:hypothetical protein
MAAKNTKKSAAEARDGKSRVSSRAREIKARAREEAIKRSEAARKGWETRKRKAEEAERKRLEALERRREKDRLRRAEKREAERKRLEALERRREKDRQRRAEKREAERLKREAERLEREKKEKKKEAAKARAQQQAEKRRVCNDLISDPPTDPELVFGTACFDSSSFHQFSDGAWEGEITERGKKDWKRTWDRLERFLRPLLSKAKGWWMRVGVFGVEPSMLGLGEPDFDRDRYQKSRKTWGKAFVPGSIGRNSPWRRIRPSSGKRTKFTTAATVFLTGREITKRFEAKGFKNIVLSVQVFSGNQRPSGD